MSLNPETLLEGSYLYYQNDVNYSQENFKLVQLPDQQIYHIYAEILSRIETGEFLKILVHYEMNYLYQPFYVKIEKSIGNRYAQEVFNYDHVSQEMAYHFKNTLTSKEIKKNVNSKHYLTSPAFSTSGIFTLSKKFDATGRTPVVLVSSSNEWEFVNPPDEHIVFAEYKARDVEDFQINNSSLSASHLCLYEHDSSHVGPQELPVEMYISKHYGIPYQLEHGSQKIVIKNLKKNTA